MTMQNMVDFSTLMLDSVANFLGTPPIFYLFSLVCFLFIAKLIMILVGRRS